MSSTPNPWLATAVGLSVVASLVSSRTANFTERVSIQPRSPAFSIWSVIFPLLLLAAGVHAGTPAFPPRAVLALVGSLVCATAWAESSRRRLRRAAAASLVGACVAAWLAAVRLRRGRGRHRRRRRPRPRRPRPRLYAGWLAVAAALSVALADPERLDSPVTLAVAVVLASAAAIVWRQPLASLSVAWAVALQPPTLATSTQALLFACSVVGGVGAALW